MEWRCFMICVIRITRSGQLNVRTTTVHEIIQFWTRKIRNYLWKTLSLKHFYPFLISVLFLPYVVVSWELHVCAKFRNNWFSRSCWKIFKKIWTDQTKIQAKSFKKGIHIHFHDGKKTCKKNSLHFRVHFTRGSQTPDSLYIGPMYTWRRLTGPSKCRAQWYLPK